MAFCMMKTVKSSNNTPWAPDSWAKTVLNFASNLPRYDRFSNAKIVHVSLTFCIGSHFKFIYFFRVGVGVGQLGNIYMFLTDIPIKGCQGRSNRSSIVHAVSYFAYGVNDTACI
jgi:hypothetical protein